MFAFTTRATHRFYAHAVMPGDWFVFGSETHGLSAALLAQFDANRRVRLPMRAGSRSLNLSNAVAIAVYEGWRQHHFEERSTSNTSCKR
jgi:tRNA (cytidine/uridine-2'-O-)-methyltransferase